MYNRIASDTRSILSLVALLALAGCEGDDTPSTPGDGAPIGAPSALIEVPKNASVQRTFDIDNPAGVAVAASVTTRPAHGQLELIAFSGELLRVAYTPDPGYFGDDMVEYRIQSAGSSADGTIAFEVQNAAPEVTGTTVLRPSGGGVTARLEVTDADGDALDFEVAEAPEHGTLGALDVTPIYVAPGQLSHYRVEVDYEPDADAAGQDSFRLVIDEGNGPLASVLVDVLPNDPPHIQNAGPDGRIEVEGMRGEAIDLVIDATSPTGAALEFSVADPPENGNLGPIEAVALGAAQLGAPGLGAPAQQASGAATFRATATYEPRPDFVGTEIIQIAVSDGIESVVVPVEVTVASAGPTAMNGSAGVYRHRPTLIEISGVDPNGFPLEFEIVEVPAQGSLSDLVEVETVQDPDGGTRTTARLFYVPMAPPVDEAVDEVSFRFTVSDGLSTSEPARVDMSLVNTPPAAFAHQALVSQGEPKLITLTGRDVDQHQLDFTIVHGPEHGSLGEPTVTSLTTATVLYTPDPGYSGPDEFVFQVDDGIAISNQAEVSVTVVAAP